MNSPQRSRDTSAFSTTSLKSHTVHSRSTSIWHWILSSGHYRKQRYIEFPVDDSFMEMVRDHLVPTSLPIHPAVHEHDGRHMDEWKVRHRLFQPKAFQYDDEPRGGTVTIWARKLEQPDGTRYSLPVSQRMQEAERDLLKSTYLVYDMQNISTNDPILGRVEFDQWETILETLRVVSRGHLFICNNGWLQPTLRWTTLAMHIASRCEQSLMNDYQRQTINPKQSTVDCNRASFWNHMNQETIDCYIQKGIALVLKENLIAQHQKQKLRMSCSDLRQNPLWYFLDTATSLRFMTPMAIEKIPLLQIGTSRESFLHQLQKNVRSIVSDHHFCELIEDEEHEKNLIKSKKRKPKKRKKIKEYCNGSQQSRRNILGNQVRKGVEEVEPSPEPELSVNDGSENEDINKEVTDSVIWSEAPLHGISQLERNRNAVVCLSILDQILDCVFHHVDEMSENSKSSNPSPTTESNDTQPSVSGNQQKSSRHCKDTILSSAHSPKSETHMYVKSKYKNSQSDTYEDRSNVAASRWKDCESPQSFYETHGRVSRESLDEKPRATRGMNRHPSAQSLTASLGCDIDDRTAPSSPIRGYVENEVSLIKDGSTTITSALSVKDASDYSNLKSERDTYRDMCLTLGAEVSKLKNLLASQKGSSLSQNFPQHALQFPQIPVSFGPDTASHFIFQTIPKATNPGAMSDAGYRADFESHASEDDMTGRYIHSRPISSVATAAGSDISFEHSSPHYGNSAGVAFPPTRELYDPVSLHGMQSRLATDVLRFLDSINLQLRQQENSRQKALSRMTRLVKAVWPRAQVKLYGSHATGLCLPCSDLDFVVCLPAVHKNTLALTPGALEGQNAINESSQRLLHRKLKGENWIDQKSMKLIEHTMVPVIKFTTKDAKSRVLQLDITFDGPEHHGLEAIMLVNDILEDLPMIRPIVIVLKQFLSDRGLLTAFTGGLSSYCLFLMVARYLQEQDSSWGDCGSLLLGFLDFYGNHFDPRSTGISVRHRAYFPRHNVPSGTRPQQNSPIEHNAWPRKVRGLPPTSPMSQIERRNSFSDRGHLEYPTHRFPQPPQTRGVGFASSQTLHFQSPEVTAGPNEQLNHESSYTLDPLLVEDPLASANNVGRNSFRIFQIQRAFSDAHRALNAALEWDMDSGEESPINGIDYSLLKCLLQSEDTLFDL